MKELEEQRLCVKFCYKLGKNVTETFQMHTQANAENCMSRTQCYEWFKRFQEGRASVDEDPRPGRHSTSTDDGHVQMVRHVIRANRLLTVREVAEEVDISVGSCHQILTEKLQMRRVSAKFVPRLLTNDQKENRVQISQELLANASGNYNFLKNIITEMKRGFMAMMLKQRCNRRSGWAKGLLDQRKHGCVGQRSR